MQRLLYQAKWDADAVCAQVADYLGAHLSTPEGVLVIDDSGIPKKGTKSAGVAPQYCGVRHAVITCQVGVFACYVSGRGMALVDRELYLPAVWTTDRERCQAAGVPESVGFATGGTETRCRPGTERPSPCACTAPRMTAP